MIGWIYSYKDRILKEERSRSGGFRCVRATHNMAVKENGWLSGGSKVQTLGDLPDPHGAHPSKPIVSPQMQVTVVLCKASELFHDTQRLCDVRNEHQAGSGAPVSLSPFLLATPCSRHGAEYTFKFLPKCHGSKYMNCLLLENL